MPETYECCTVKRSEKVVVRPRFVQRPAAGRTTLLFGLKRWNVVGRGTKGKGVEVVQRHPVSIAAAPLSPTWKPPSCLLPVALPGARRTAVEGHVALAYLRLVGQWGDYVFAPGNGPCKRPGLHVSSLQCVVAGCISPPGARMFAPGVNEFIPFVCVAASGKAETCARSTGMHVTAMNAYCHGGIVALPNNRFQHAEPGRCHAGATQQQQCASNVQ